MGAARGRQEVGWGSSGTVREARGTLFGVMGELCVLMEVVLTQIYTSGKTS